MLTIMGPLHHIDMVLGWWLCERQVKSGGLNGRPGMRPDVCYSVWVNSSLILIDGVHWIDKDKLAGFILILRIKRMEECQISQMMLLMFPYIFWCCCIRATCGLDLERICFYGSDSPLSAAREILFSYFGKVLLQGDNCFLLKSNNL